MLNPTCDLSMFRCCCAKCSSNCPTNCARCLTNFSRCCLNFYMTDLTNCLKKKNFCKCFAWCRTKWWRFW